MMAKGQAAVLDHGRLADRHLHCRRPQARSRLSLRPGADRLGQARLHSQLGFRRLLQAEGPRLSSRARSCSPISSCRRSSRPSSTRPRARSRPGSTSICRRASILASRQSQKDLQASIAAGTLVRSMAHNMTILQKYRGAMMEAITYFVNTPNMSAGRCGQRDGRRRRRAEVASRHPVVRRPPPARPSWHGGSAS